MTIISDQQATLAQDHWTKLFPLTFGPCRLTVTGIAGEFTAIPLRIRRNFRTQEFQGMEAVVKGFTLFPFGEISAKAPAGVGSLDIVYEVRTRGDF
ncbi:MAG: hypothetical protein QOJ14_681 [Thermoleophilaceae bacterium]|jgi:hypothetical protein|nr:hypothetical protein [Thermoleophilaceae bacterium]